MKAKVSKVMIWPVRKLNLGNYETIDLSVGVEATFEKPVAFGSKDIEETLTECRKIAKGEMGVQIEPYKKMLNNAKGVRK